MKFIVTLFLILSSYSLMAESASDTAYARNLEAYAKFLSGGGDLLFGYGELARANAANTSAYGQLVEAQSNYIRQAGEARLAYAKAKMVEAQTAYKWEQVRHYRNMMKRLELDLRRLARDEYYARQKIELIEDCSKTVGVLASGKFNAYIARALNQLIFKVVPIGITNSVLMVTLPELGEESFVPNRENKKSLPFPGGNVGQLIAFASTNDFSFAPWGEAHVGVMLALDAISKGAEEKAQKYYEYMDGIRKGTFDIWKAPELPQSIGGEGL